MHQRIPVAILEEIRCRHCQNYITSGPVHSIPDEGTLLCGRCRMLAHSQFRNYAFEVLSEYFIYPCKNWSKHCPNALLWNASSDHEHECGYRGGCSTFCLHPGASCSSNRHLSSLPNEVEMIKLQDLQFLECIICQMYISAPPVYLTIEGRNVCHRCVNSNGVPSGCTPNYAYEKLAVYFLFPCLFRERGCTFSVPFGRASWEHESQCAYAPSIIHKKSTSSTVVSAAPIAKRAGGGGKEKGVIQTHSGHIYATITSQSIPFAPPTGQRQHNVITKEIEQRMKKKHHQQFDDETFRSDQSEASVEFDAVSRTTATSATADNVSRSTQHTLDYSVTSYGTTGTGYLSAADTDGGSNGTRLSSFRYSTENNGGMYRNSDYHEGAMGGGMADAMQVKRTESMINELKFKQNRNRK